MNAVTPAMQRALTQLESQGNLTGVRRTTIRALENRNLVTLTPSGYKRVSENLDTPRPNRFLVQWFDPQYRISPTRDIGQADYVFWDRAIRCKAKGLEISGAFLKPLGSKITAWTLGLQPKFKFKRPKTQQLFTTWWGLNQPNISRAFEDAVDRADSYLVVNPPDMEGNLKLTIVPANVVTPLVDDNDYSKVIGWRIAEVYEHPTRPGDAMTIVDDYTAEFRLHKVYRSGVLINQKKYTNLLGRVPVVHLAFNKGSNETFGHAAGEGLTEILQRYGEVIEAAIVGNIKQGRPTPVIEKMGSMDAIQSFWQQFGRRETRQLPDGTTEEYWVLDLSSDDAVTLGGDATFKYEQPGSFASDVETILGLLFYLMLQYTEIPEFIWGNAIASSKASAESQLPPFEKYIQKVQGECLYWVIELAQIVVAYLSLFESGVAADDVPMVQWPKLTSQDGKLTVDAVALGLNKGILDDETALGLLPLDVDDPKAVIEKVKKQAEERRLEDQKRMNQQDIPLPDITAQIAPIGLTVSEAQNQTGVMAAFFLDDTAANLLTKAAQEAGVPNITPAGEMHLTLAFMGDKADLGDSQEAIQQALEAFAASEFSIRGTISGVGRFTNSGETDALYASFDSPDLPEFRQSLIDSLVHSGVKLEHTHGFTPHITLAYLPKDTPMPDVRLQPFEMILNRLTLAWGGSRTEYDLKGEAALAAAA